jgi:methylase of polypeptide subunit release factors
LDAATEWLAPGGWLVTEIGATQGAEVVDLFTRTLTSVNVLQDLPGRDRVVRGSKPLG